MQYLAEEFHPERVTQTELQDALDFIDWLINGEYQTHLGRDEEGWIWYAHRSHNSSCDACIARTREEALWTLFNKTGKT